MNNPPTPRTSISENNNNIETESLTYVPEESKNNNPEQYIPKSSSYDKKTTTTSKHTSIDSTSTIQEPNTSNQSDKADNNQVNSISIPSGGKHSETTGMSNRISSSPMASSPARSSNNGQTNIQHIITRGKRTITSANHWPGSSSRCGSSSKVSQLSSKMSQAPSLGSVRNEGVGVSRKNQESPVPNHCVATSSIPASTMTSKTSVTVVKKQFSRNSNNNNNNNNNNIDLHNTNMRVSQNNKINRRIED